MSRCSHQCHNHKLPQSCGGGFVFNALIHVHEELNILLNLARGSSFYLRNGGG